jgi:hypothetical protein
MADLQDAVFIGPAFTTRCVSPAGDPLMLVRAGTENVLRPNAFTVIGLWFFKTAIGRITYTAHVLSGIASQ